MRFVLLSLRKVRVAYLLSALVAVMAGVVTFRETFGAPTAYTVSELPGGGAPCKLNQFGDVAGKSADAASGESRATRWDRGGLQRRILNRFHGGDYSSASGINDAGHLAGAANLVGSVVPILWKPGVGVQRVTLLPGDNCGQALAINNVGRVVGYSSGRGGKRAFMWRPGTGARDLGVLPAGQYSTAVDINNSDNVVGVSDSAAGERAVLWTNDGEVVDLGMLPGDTSSEATAINNNGAVIGCSKGPHGTRGFLWTENRGMEELGILPDGDSSRALGINDLEVIVGTSTSSSGDRAIIWTRTAGIRDLNDQASLPFGVVLLEAHSINNAGQILVLGMNRHEHENEGADVPCAPAPPSSYLLTPQ